MGVVKIGPCHYRKLIIDENLKFKGQSNTYDDEEYDEDEVRELDDQMWYERDEWVLKMDLPAVFHRFIIGKQGANKSRLERESGAKIQIPNREDQEDCVWL